MPSPTEPPRPYIGGQAVIEGVMMRSPESFAVVCRRKSGALVVHEEPMRVDKKGARSFPLVRGIATLVESLRTGSRAMKWASYWFEKDLDEDEKAASTAASMLGALRMWFLGAAISIVALGTSDGSDPGAKAMQRRGNPLSMVLTLLFVIVLMVAAPQAGAVGISKLLGLNLDVTSPAFQAITGSAKLLIISLFYLALRRNEIIYRLFQYHGAEHKTISTYEANEELVVENARKKTTAHARCGTTFIVMVAIVSIAVFSIVGAFLPPLSGPIIVQNLVFFAVKLPFLPLIAGITFEIQRVFARYCTTGPLRVLLWPGFLVQKITTAEPDDAQLEVALASLRATLWREQAITAPVPSDREFAAYDDILRDGGYQTPAAA